MKIKNVDSIIPDIVAKLREAGVINIQDYKKRLHYNSGDTDKIEDILSEAYAAIIFANNKFKVTMRESPDLRIELNDDIAYAEVKHFRTKNQDRKDEKAMRETDGLVRVSNIAPEEGRKPWEQIADVAIKAAKRGQYMQNAPNLLVIKTDSNAISGIYISTAINYYNEIASQSGDPRLFDLNAFMMLDKKYYPGGQIDELIGEGGRSVIVKQIASPTTPIKPSMLYALKNIRIWW